MSEEGQPVTGGASTGVARPAVARFWIAGLLFIVILVATGFAVSAVRASNRAQAAIRLRERSNILSLAVRQPLDKLVIAMYGARTLVRASDSVTPAEWRTFYEDYALSSDFFSVLSFIFVRRVPAADGAPERWLIELDEPASSGPQYIGRDLAVDTTRAELIGRAVASDAPAVSDIAPLLSGQLGVLAYLPVYEGVPPADAASRARAAIGVVGVAIRAQDFFNNVFGSVPGGDQPLLIRLYGVPPAEISGAEPLAERTFGELPSGETVSVFEPITFANQTYTMEITGEAGYGLRPLVRTFPLAVGVGGFLVGVAGALAVLMLAGERARVQRALTEARQEVARQSDALIRKNAELAREVEARTAALAQKVSESEGSKTAILNVLEDLTAAKEQLESSKAYDESLLASIADGVLAVDPGGRVTEVNDAAVRLLGFSRRQLLGQLWSDVLVLADDEGHAIPDADRPLTKALGAVTYQVFADNAHFYIRADGTRFPVAMDCAPVLIGGRVAGAVEVFRDITREREVDRAKSEFVSLASHQLRTPLTAIGWYTELLLGEAGDSLRPEHRQYLQQVYDSNRRMVALVDSLLNVSRLEMGSFAVAPESVQIESVVRSILKDFDIYAQQKKLTLRTEVGQGIGIVSLDSHLLSIILQNLVSNAIKYTPEGGTVTVTARREEPWLLLGVADTGIGIPQGAQKHMFEKLFRADNARLSDPDGSGLGLYMVKGILDQVGGTIAVQSEEGKGTTFTVRLPLSGMERREGDRKFIAGPRA